MNAGGGWGGGIGDLVYVCVGKGGGIENKNKKRKARCVKREEEDLCSEVEGVDFNE